MMFIFSPFVLFGQNTLWLNNGKKITIVEYKINNNDLIVYKNLKNKSKAVSVLDVYSITENNGAEHIIYVPDTSYEGAFNILEMKNFVQGQYDADLKFKSPLTTIGGIAVAGVSSVVINPVYVFLVSGAYCSTIGLSKTSKKKLAIPEEYAKNEHYILGFKRVARHKRIKNSIVGSTIGLAVGLGTFAIISKK